MTSYQPKNKHQEKNIEETVMCIETKLCEYYIKRHSNRTIRNAQLLRPVDTFIDYRPLVYYEAHNNIPLHDLSMSS